MNKNRNSASIIFFGIKGYFEISVFDISRTDCIWNTRTLIDI